VPAAKVVYLLIISHIMKAVEMYSVTAGIFVAVSTYSGSISYTAGECILKDIILKFQDSQPQSQ
jgi:hypothetical protein